MGRRRARMTSMAVALVAVVGLAACSAGEADPIAEPTSGAPSVSATPSASPSPAVEKPERPAVIDENTQAGAEAAAVYFLELDSYMQATGDTDEWEAMSHQTCEFCAARLEQAREITDAGDSFSGGEARASVLETYLQDPVTGIWPIDLLVVEDASVITRPDGTIALEADASEYRRHVEVFQRDGAWVIVGVAAVKED